MASPLTPEVLTLLESIHRDATASRFFSAVGLVALLYDHALSLPDEISLIWKSPPSFAKYAFLLNRYLVPVALITIAFEMCGFSGYVFTDGGCQFLITTTAILAVISLGIANVLVLMRVVMLWDKNKTVSRLMCIGFACSFTATLSLMAATLSQVFDGIQFNEFAGMCVTTTTTKFLIATWASPMLFEILVLIFTLVNLFDRPRSASIRLTKALTRDGINFFMALTGLRTLNVALAAVNKASLSMLAVFFVWAMTTLVLNRCLLNVRRVEVMEAYESSGIFQTVTPEGLHRTVSPFGGNGLPPDYDDVWDIHGDITDGEVPMYDGPRSETPLAIELKKFTPWSNRNEKTSQSEWF